jgi:hypothetical protein
VSLGKRRARYNAPVAGGFFVLHWLVFGIRIIYVRCRDRVAEHKYNSGDIQGDLITIANADLVGEILPDIRTPIYANPNLPAVLRYDDVTVNCPTLGEAVMAWHRLEGSRKYSATITVQDGAIYQGAQIDTLYAAN